jgi:hypothetical protein
MRYEPPLQGGSSLMRGGDSPCHRAGKMEYISSGCSPPRPKLDRHLRPETNSYNKTMNEDKLNEIQEFFDEKILGFMVTDLERAVAAKTNFLTALGCLIYTEMIGVFLPPISGERGSTEAKRFYRCLFRFRSSEYLVLLDKEVRRETTQQSGLYEHLRHSASHAYQPTIKKRNSDGTFNFVHVTIAQSAKDQSNSPSPPMGIKDDGDFVIATRNYARELKEAAILFRKNICIDRDPEWVRSGARGIDFLTRSLN